MKKIVFLIMAAIITTTIFVGCGNKDMQVKNEMNGSGDKKIGEYGIEYYDGNITDDDLVKFFNEKVKDSKLNYVTLINEKNKSEGYVFSGTDGLFNFGEIDKDGMLQKSIKSGIITNDKIQYLEN
ncbi:hypothetical protein P5F25_02660 [Clostridium perfringens]|nr:hypothetical protein [Clostridium perfringens]